MFLVRERQAFARRSADDERVDPSVDLSIDQRAELFKIDPRVRKRSDQSGRDTFKNRLVHELASKA